MAGGLWWEFLLAPQTSSLMFEEVVYRVLVENRYKIESLLDHVWELWAQLRRELNNLSWACKDELEKSAWKKMKRDMEQRQRDLKSLEATISQHESSLRGAQVQPEGTPAHEDDPSDSEAKGAMATTPAADDAPAMSTPESLTSPPGKEQTRSMEVDDGDDCQPPASPISHREDELLTGGGAVGVEGEMANLMVSSPRAVMVVTRVPMFRRPFPSVWPPLTYLREALLANASRTSTKKRPEPLHWKS